MPYYPVFLDLRGRKGVVIGGGEVAERKVQSLLESGAQVTLISPSLTRGLEKLYRQGDLAWEAREYQEGDLEGAFLVIAATDDPEVNRAISREAQERGILVNVVDMPHLCNFIAPSVVRRGEVTVAISTGGLSPALARKIREGLSRCEALDYAELASLLAQARWELKQRQREVPPERWQEAINAEVLSLYRAGKAKEAKACLLSYLGVEPSREGQG